MIIDIVTDKQAFLVEQQIKRLEKELTEWKELLEKWEEKQRETSK